MSGVVVSCCVLVVFAMGGDRHQSADSCLYVYVLHAARVRGNRSPDSDRSIDRS